MTISKDHPFVTRMREISQVLLRISEIEGKANADLPPGGKTGSYYEGAVQARNTAAKMIETAIAEHTAEPAPGNSLEARQALRRAIAGVSHSGKLQLIPGGRP